MDTTLDPTLGQDIQQILAEVPPQVRAYFASGKVENVAKSLVGTYQLHIDQGAIVEREIILLLLGLKDSSEFSATLASEAKLDQETVARIAQDVNAQIFVPLRAQMQNAATTVSQAPTQPRTQPVAPPRPTRVSMPAPNYAPPRPPAAAPQPSPWASEPSVMIQANPALPTRPHQEDYISKVPRYVPPVNRPPVPGMPARPASPTPPAQKPLAQTINIVINTSKMLEDHEEPAITFKAPPARIIPPPPNLPGAMPPPLPKPVTPPPLPRPVVTVPPPAPRPPNSPDPYREPVDGE